MATRRRMGAIAAHVSGGGGVAA
eukprot:SAG25_NODE_9867_length_355_cov_0.609375_1_plen_22_part_01